MIMRYYKYPERGTGNYSYTTETHQFPVEFDFGNTPFDWATTMANTTRHKPMQWPH